MIPNGSNISNIPPDKLPSSSSSSSSLLPIQQNPTEGAVQEGDGGAHVVPMFQNNPKYVKRKGFPTRAEMDHFSNFTIVENDSLERLSGGILEADCVKLLFKNLENLPTTKSLDHHVADLFDIFIRRMIQQAGGTLRETRYWLCLRHPEWSNDEIWISHRTHNLADGHTLVNSIAKIARSNKELKIDRQLQLHMKVFATGLLTGSGGAISEQVLKIFGRNSPSVVGEGYCLPKALAIGQVWSDKKNTLKGSDEWKRLNNIWTRLSRAENTPDRLQRKIHHQTEMAKELLGKAGMNQSTVEHDIGHLRQLAAYLCGYQIVVWTVNQTNTPTLLLQFNEHQDGFIGLIFHNGHYDFFVPKCEKICTRFCYNCSKLVDKNHSLNCTAACERCGWSNCIPDTSSFITCEKCNITFPGDHCYRKHLQKKSGSALPYCEIWERCDGCSKITKRFTYSKVKHVCDAEKFCTICQKPTMLKHGCYHALITESGRKKLIEKQNNWTMVVYDFECIVASPDGNKSGLKHTVNLVTYRIICQRCIGGFCQSCGPVQYISYKLRPGEYGTVLDRFCNWLLTDPRITNTYLIAHNGGRYDHVFLLPALCRMTSTTPKFICNGGTFISAELELKDRYLTFRDSWQYIPMKLASMPKAFGLEIDSKGYFPYLLNFPESYGRSWDTKPPKHYYQPEYMGCSEAEQFEKWYEQFYDEPFDFDAEILAYGLNDTEILVQSISKYIQARNICASIFSNWNPIIQSPTLAGFVMFVMSMEHFTEDDVGYIPENGFPGRNNSVLALKYLLWLENQDPNLSIQHSLKGNEFQIGNFFVDGYVEATRTVLEIYGCLWHGCPRCYHNRDAECPRRKDFTMAQLYEQTIAREAILKHLGYNVTVVWECEIHKMLEESQQMKSFFKRCRNTFQLIPRDAMYGGRTQPFKTFAKSDHEYTIEYYDFCSLYPYINMKGAYYPIGQPQTENRKFWPIIPGEPTPYRGLVYCDVLPPTRLELPVLPYRSNGKLIFPLCRTCGDLARQQECTHHQISDRYLTGIWTSNEMNLAIAKGYQILRYHETWHWAEEDWFIGGFFSSFLSPLLVIKHQASGWPRSNMSDDEKADHVAMIEQNDGVKIDPLCVEKNPALRSLAKLFLNSAWGKFAQNPCKTETELLKLEDYVAISNFFEAPGYEPKMFKTWNEEYAFVSRKHLKEALTTRRFSNIVYGIITTSAARIRLYNAMDRVGADNLIYVDTDSVMFRQKRGVDLLGDLIGDGLGMLTNEVPKDKKIVEVVTVSPKVYGIKFESDTGDISYSIKAKGITLNKKSAEKVSFDTMKTMMESWVEKRVIAPLHAERFVFNRGTNLMDGVQTVLMEKIVRPVSDKGIFTSAGALLPYGYISDEFTLLNDYKYL